MTVMHHVQVQHPEELEACMGGLQARVQQLAEEASQAEQLRDGQQTLLSANQRKHPLSPLLLSVCLRAICCSLDHRALLGLATTWMT